MIALAASRIDSIGTAEALVALAAFIVACVLTWFLDR